MREIRLVPLAAADFPDWSARVRRRLAAHRADSGAMPPREARDTAVALLDRLLPGGVATPYHHVLTAPGVGHAWLSVRDGEAFGYDVALASEADPALARPLLAAVEDRARVLGATLLRFNVFRHDTTVARMVDDPAYRTASMQLRLPLDGPAGTAGPVNVALRPMTAAEFAAFLDGNEAAYAEDLVRSGTASPAEARRRAAAELAELLPDGAATADQVLWTGYDGDTAVGDLWLERERDSRGTWAFVLDLAVRPELRRRGHGRAMLCAAERECRARGMYAIGLSVFGFNHAARALYDSLGYRAIEELLVRDL